MSHAEGFGAEDKTPERFRALWDIGHDTYAIAQICRVHESVVYNSMNAGDCDYSPSPTRRVPGKLIPYAGKS